MQRRHDLLGERCAGDRPASFAGDAERRSEQGLCGGGAQEHEDAWLHDGELAVEPRTAGGNLHPIGLVVDPARASGLPFEMFHGIRDAYSFFKTAGPARLAITDRGLTFASNGERGLCIAFHSPVSGIDRPGRIRHPELTVTVLDVDGLAEALVPRDSSY